MGGKLKISEIFSFEKGPLQSSKNEPGDYDFITASSEWKTHSSYAYDCEALLVAVAASGSLGRTHYVEGKFIGSDLCFVLTPKDQEKLPVNLKLYFHIFNAVKDDLVYRTATGSAKKAINKTNFGNYEIPYFDIETQNKYAKLFDDFVVLKTSLESEILSQEENLSKLRQSILQDAVQGKLTQEWREQNPKVEPASELLKKIKAEKEQLVKEKKIRKEKPLPPITKDEIPFDIPETWKWCRLGEFTTIKGGKRLPKGRKLTREDTGRIYIRVTDMKNGTIDSSDLHYITEDVFEQISSYIIKEDDIYLTIVGATIGKLGLVPSKFNNMNLTENAARIIKYNIDKYFLYYFLISPLVQNQFLNETKQVGVPKLALHRVGSSIIPLPPSEEQKAIVKKVNQLLANCDVLEQEIKESKTNAEKLMQSVLSKLLGEENNTLEKKTISKKEIKKPLREIKYNSKTLLMDLVKLLKENGKLHAEDLWKMSKFPNDIDAFYAELKKQIEEEKAIKEVANEKGYLELA